MLKPLSVVAGVTHKADNSVKAAVEINDPLGACFLMQAVNILRHDQPSDA